MNEKKTNAVLLIDAFTAASDTRTFSVLVKFMLGGIAVEERHEDLVSSIQSAAKRLGFGQDTKPKHDNYEQYWRERLAELEALVLGQRVGA